MAGEIACLGWGSLIWDLDGLPVGKWRCDGPPVRVEFVRQSLEHHLTLVLFEKAEPVPSLWGRMNVGTLEEAIRALAKREGRGKPLSNSERDIGQWPRDDGTPTIIDLESWATRQGVDHVVWTALRPKFRGKDDCWPSAAEAVDHLNALSDKTRPKAEQYVRNTPHQIDTAYRRRIGRCLGWEAPCIGGKGNDWPELHSATAHPGAWVRLLGSNCTGDVPPSAQRPEPAVECREWNGGAI